jgi:DNA-binding NtrC family response regulator
MAPPRAWVACPSSILRRRQRATVLKGLAAGADTQSMPRDIEHAEHSAERRRKPIVLVIDDDVLVLRTLVRLLDEPDIELATLSNHTGLSACLADPRLAVVLLDIHLGTTSGLDVLELIRRARPEVEVIMMTGFASVEGAVGSMRRGAFDYFAKPFDDLAQVRSTLRRALSVRLKQFDTHRMGAGSTQTKTAALPIVRRGAAVEPPLSLDAYEKLALERALRENEGDASRAAKALRIGRSTFYRKAARHDLQLTRSDVQRDVMAPRRVGPTIPIG